jgi:hypothetical protein
MRFTVALPLDLVWLTFQSDIPRELGVLDFAPDLPGIYPLVENLSPTYLSMLLRYSCLRSDAPPPTVARCGLTPVHLVIGSQMRPVIKRHSSTTIRAIWCAGN